MVTAVAFMAGVPASMLGRLVSRVRLLLLPVVHLAHPAARAPIPLGLGCCHQPSRVVDVTPSVLLFSTPILEVRSRSDEDARPGAVWS
jgi:hypothetical protein